MLVLARKKNEAILIDGLIRIEVVNVGRATVRVRLRAPRGLAPPPHQALICREGAHRESSPARVFPVGMDDFLMTLVNQQVVNLGEFISLGVVDADKTRAVFFVDAPLGMSVTAIKHEDDDRPRSSTRQNLLPFMGQGKPADRDQASPVPHPDAAGQVTSAGDVRPRLLPFPSRMAKRQRG